MCPKGEFSLSANDSYCQKCPLNSICEKNGSFISVNPGFWRSSYYSTGIYKCYLSEACMGNTCSKEYDGPLCDLCIRNQQKYYFKTPKIGCKICNEEISEYFIVGTVNY